MKNLEKEDEYFRKFFSEVGTEDTPIGFHKSILEKLSPKGVVSEYKPVISSMAWKIIGVTIALLVVSVLLFLPYGGNNLPLLDHVPVFTTQEFSISLPKMKLPTIELSSVAIQSLIAFMLFASISIISTVKKWRFS